MSILGIQQNVQWEKCASELRDISFPHDSTWPEQCAFNGTI